MNKLKKYTLDNGLKIYLMSDENKNRTIGYLITYAGGKDTSFMLDDKRVNVPRGCAHFLEHYLIEHSIYGNALRMFSDDYIETNGLTNYERTGYYINTVHDFKENFIKLLNIVNNPVFDEKSINNTKNPIISEIDRFNDEKYLFLRRTTSSAMFNKDELYNTLGEKEDIYNMTVDDLRNFHKALYKPENQIIVISGNVNEDIIDVIKDEYLKFNNNNINSIQDELIEDKNVAKNYSECKCGIKEPAFSVGLKVPLNDMTPLEKNKLDYYLSYIIEYNFDIKSKIFNNLKNDNIITYSFSRNFVNYTSDFMGVFIGNESNDFELVRDSIIDTLNNLEYDEEDFNTWKNHRIINTINKMEEVSYKINNFMNNYNFYGYEDYDDLEFIKSLNFKECKDMISNIDFSNICVIRNIVD